MRPSDEDLAAKVRALREITGWTDAIPALPEVVPGPWISPLMALGHALFERFACPRPRWVEAYRFRRQLGVEAPDARVDAVLAGVDPGDVEPEVVDRLIDAALSQADDGLLLALVARGSSEARDRAAAVAACAGEDERALALLDAGASPDAVLLQAALRPGAGKRALMERARSLGADAGRAVAAGLTVEDIARLRFG